MIKKIPLAGLFIFCFLPLFLAAQGYSYVNYNIKEGLAGSMVYCAVQDHDGFMWFGTETGLSRFDGKHFVNFTTADGLSDNEIIKLFVDSKNRVWIIPFQNKICYYQNGKLHTDQNDMLLKKIGYSGGAIDVMENKRGELAVVQLNGVAVVHPNDSVTHVVIPRNIAKIHLGGLDFNGEFMMHAIELDNLNLLFYAIKGNRLVRVMETKIGIILTANGIFLSKDVRILVASPDSLLFITPIDSFRLPVGPSFSNISRINDSLVAISSRSHTRIVNVRTRKIEDQFLENENISSVLEDRENNLWFTSMGGGVYRLASRKFKAATLMVNDNAQPVFSIARWNNAIIFGSNHYTLWQLNLLNNRLEQITQHPGLFQDRVTVLEKTEKNNLLIGTDGGLYVLENKRFRSLSQSFSIKSIAVEKDTVYVSHNMGLGRLLLTSSAYETELLTRTTAAYKRGDSIFAGTLKGLYIRSRANRTDTLLGTDTPVVSGRISSIKESADGTIWIATYGAGVIGYRNGKFNIRLNRDSGLTSNIIRSLFIRGNTLWLGTDKGLNRVETGGGRYRIRHYSTSDGIISDIINAVYIDSNTVYVGTPAGVSWFSEDEVFTNSMCVLKLTGISSDKRLAITDTNRLRFDHYDSDIRFEFTGISFKSAGEINYRYRLTGLDQEWHHTTENFLNYPTLPSGNYVLELQAINKFGVHSSVLRIEFSVAYLLWEKTWFRILSALIFATLLWIFVNWRIRKVRQQEELKTETSRKMAELEQMALKAQMNPHFIFNSLNAIQHYMFDQDVESANRYITEFSRLIRLTLEFSSKPKVSLEDEIRFLTTYLELETKRFEGKFRYQIHTGKRLDPVHIFIPPMILQPYIENSIRHGIRYRPDNKGLVKLDFNTDGDMLFITVEDNGVGRARSRELKGTNNIKYQSQGMDLTARRIEMINKNAKVPISISISDVDPGTELAGTRVKICIPLPK